MDPLERHRFRAVTAWLAHFSSCRFAARFAKHANQPDGRIGIAVVDPWDVPPEDLASMDSMLDAFGQKERGALLAFPGIDQERDVAYLLSALDRASDRWSVYPIDADADPVRLQVTWRTKEGHESMVMGLAPFLTMPPTRRMPYVGLALWPGRKAEKTKDVAGVSFRDMPSELVEKEHRRLVKETREGVDLAWGTKRDGELFAFRLPSRVTDRS